ncbi:MAG: ATP citrate synthase [Candidatus Helarchaeota archaeon]|nr:ATP citrate synthase [Candidatus Helarchaeota archaeon]
MPTKPDYLLFDRNTQAIIFGNQPRAVQRMLDFDYICRREKLSVVAVVNPTRAGYMKSFLGTKEVLIPMYRTLQDAVSHHPDADVMVNFASYRSADRTTKEALETPSIRTVAIIAEGIPERRERELALIAKRKNKWIIGPATIGGLRAGAFKVGNTGGALDNLKSLGLYRPGSVGLVTVSGGMLNEMFNIIHQNSDGIFEGIAIGGDRYPGSELLDHILRYEQNPEIKMIVMLGEVGGIKEYDVVNALKEGKISKPLVAWITGTCAKIFPTEVQFGHAGAKSGESTGSADAKNAALSEAGAVVPNTFDDFGEKIKVTFEKLKDEGKIEKKEELEPPIIPMNYSDALKKGMIRKPATFTCTISDESGEELLYAGMPISEVIEKDIGIGGVIGLLWFKKLLPEYARKFIEKVLMLAADHGPAVSGAHNAIITARAGKNIIDSLVSGLLTIGPRFGGAIADAARYFKRAFDSKMTPEEFVGDMKAKGIYISGIGHRIKSVQNPDIRVVLLKNFAFENFPKTDLLKYALEVEKVTTAKRNNLILNVDGCIGILFVDIMRGSGMFTDKEIDEFIEMGGLNGLFVVARGIGFIGHALDQKRQKARLYRHPFDDILYLSPEEEKEMYGKGD